MDRKNKMHQNTISETVDTVRNTPIIFGLQTMVRKQIDAN